MYEEKLGYDSTVEILARMREGTRWRWPVTFKTAEVLLRPLTMGEEIDVEVRVTQNMKSKEPAYRVPINESAMRAKIILEVASTSEPGKTDPMLTDNILNQFTNAELLAFMKEYQTVCDKCDPSIDSLTRQQIDEMVEALKKTPSEVLHSALTGLSFWQLRDLSASIIQEHLHAGRSPGG
jgi:hypothetical protein